MSLVFVTSVIIYLTACRSMALLSIIIFDLIPSVLLKVIVFVWNTLHYAACLQSLELQTDHHERAVLIYTYSYQVPIQSMLSVSIS